MKARTLLAIVAALVIAFAVYWLTRSGDSSDAKRAQAGAAASNVASREGARAPAMTPDARAAAHLGSGHGAAERAALLDAIAKARSRRLATAGAAPHATGATGAPSAAGSDSTGTTLDIIDKTGDTSEWEKRTLGTLDSLLGQCYDLGRAEDPSLAGTIALRFKLVGEPGVGGLLERVDILDENSSITQQTIRDCITQQLYALELDPPPDGVTVEREVHLKF